MKPGANQALKTKEHEALKTTKPSEDWQYK